MKQETVERLLGSWIIELGELDLFYRESFKLFKKKYKIKQKLIKLEREVERKLIRSQPNYDGMIAISYESYVKSFTKRRMLHIKYSDILKTYSLSIDRCKEKEGVCNVYYTRYEKAFKEWERKNDV